MAPHSSTLAWKIPWVEEPGGLQSMGSLRVGHDWATSLSLFTFMYWKRKWQPTPVFLPGDTGEPGGLPSMGSHRVGHDWSDLAVAAAGDLPNPGIEPMSPALQVDPSPAEPPGKPEDSSSGYKNGFRHPGHIDHDWSQTTAGPYKHVIVSLVETGRRSEV